MKKEDKKLVNSVSSAENGIDIDAEKTAESSGPQSGESEGSAAGSEKEKTAEFEALISGRYKKQFAARVQKIIDRRLKEVKRQRENSQANERIVEALMKRFGIRDGNIEKLERVITTETMQNTNGGTDRDALLRRLMAENEYLRRRRDEDARISQAQSKAAQWRAEANEAAEEYPDFSLEDELGNEAFVELIKAGVGVKQAYEVVHLDDILANASKSTEKKVVDSIRAKGGRPVENGTDPTAGIIIGNDAAKLSKKQREEYARRAAMGERISF